MQSRPFGELADGRANNYDFLRFLFAALVIFSHSFIYVGFSGRAIDPIAWITLKQTWSGDIAVDGFFAISGCLVTASWLRSRGVLDYFKKRALRIYPGFIAATVVCLLIVGPLGASSQAQYWNTVHWGQAISDVVQLKQIQHVEAFQYATSGHAMDFVRNELDGPMWSIRIEFECYIFVALIGVLAMLRSWVVASALRGVWPAAARIVGAVPGRAVVLVLFLLAHIMYVATAPTYAVAYPFQHRLYHALAAMSAAIGHASPVFPHLYSRAAHVITTPISRIASRRQGQYDHIRCLTCFLAGMTFYLYRDSIPRSVKLVWASIAILAVVILANRFDIGIPICAGYLMFYGAYNSKWKLDRWGEKHDLSYGLYLYGWPAQALLVYYLGNAMNAYTLFAMALPIAALCALASWHFVESPALRLKSRKKTPTPVGKIDDLPQRDEAPAATISA